MYLRRNLKHIFIQYRCCFDVQRRKSKAVVLLLMSLRLKTKRKFLNGLCEVNNERMKLFLILFIY